MNKLPNYVSHETMPILLIYTLTFVALKLAQALAA